MTNLHSVNPEALDPDISVFSFSHLHTSKSIIHETQIIQFSILHKMVVPGGMFVCILIIIVDILAGLIAIQAQVIQNKSTHLRKLVFGCKEPVHKVFVLGVTAAALLALAHGIAIILGGCPCVCSMEKLKRLSGNRKMAALILILSWLIFLGGLVMLIIAAIDNSPGAKLPCRISHYHFLSNGGILSFIHGAFCIAYYVLATASVEETGRET